MWLYCHTSHLLGREAIKSYIHTSSCIFMYLRLTSHIWIYLDLSSFVFTYLFFSSLIFICLHLYLSLFSFIHSSSFIFHLLENFQKQRFSFPAKWVIFIVGCFIIRGPMSMSHTRTMVQQFFQIQMSHQILHLFSSPVYINCQTVV